MMLRRKRFGTALSDGENAQKAFSETFRLRVVRKGGVRT